MSRRGLFLDLDGTLADSHGMLRDVYARALEAIRPGAQEPAFEVISVHPLPEVVRQLCEGTGEDPAAWLARYQRWVLEGYAVVPLHPGAAELVTWAREAGWAVAVVTSAARDDSERWLAHVGLLEHLDLVVGREDVSRAKPDPEPYRHALERTGCDAASSVAIEDSAGGAAAAVAAGLRTFVLGPAGDGTWPAVAGHLETLLEVRPQLA